MYRESLTTLLTEMKSNAKHYAVIVDETRDCAGHEQLSDYTGTCRVITTLLVPVDLAFL